MSLINYKAKKSSYYQRTPYLLLSELGGRLSDKERLIPEDFGIDARRCHEIMKYPQEIEIKLTLQLDRVSIKFILYGFKMDVGERIKLVEATSSSNGEASTGHSIDGAGLRIIAKKDDTITFDSDRLAVVVPKSECLSTFKRIEKDLLECAVTKVGRLHLDNHEDPVMDICTPFTK